MREGKTKLGKAPVGYAKHQLERQIPILCPDGCQWCRSAPDVVPVPFLHRKLSIGWQLEPQWVCWSCWDEIGSKGQDAIKGMFYAERRNVFLVLSRALKAREVASEQFPKRDV